LSAVSLHLPAKPEDTTVAQVVEAVKAAFPITKLPDQIRFETYSLYKAYSKDKLDAMLVDLSAKLVLGQFEGAQYRLDMLHINASSLDNTLFANVMAAHHWTQLSDTNYEQLHAALLSAFHASRTWASQEGPAAKRHRGGEYSQGGAAGGGGGRGGGGGFAARRSTASTSGPAHRVRLEGLDDAYIKAVNAAGPDICLFCHHQGHKLKQCKTLARAKEAAHAKGATTLPVRPFTGVAQSRGPRADMAKGN
jgi:hypothetical protein